MKHPTFLDCLLVLLAASSAHAQQVHYVHETAVGGADGSTWADAYPSLDSALAAAIPGDEVWVAAGTYRPSLPIPGGGSRSDTFTIPGGVEVFGGFDGTEVSFAARAELFDATVLTGDLNGDDLPGFGNNLENSYHVVDASGTNSTTLLDGFTVTAGHANGPASDDKRGAGLRVLMGSLLVQNCAFTRNRASDNQGFGAGLAFDQSAAHAVDCHFEGNESYRGGGAYGSAGAMFERCTFHGNSAHAPGFDDGGGGLYLNGGTVLDCVFTENFADSGSGLRVAGVSRVTGCTFARGFGHGGQGGGIYARSAVEIIDCTFIENRNARGAGCFIWNGAATIRGCRFEGNLAQGDYGGGVFFYDTPGAPVMEDCVLESNAATLGGGGLNSQFSSPIIRRCTFLGNTTPASGAGANTSGRGSSRPRYANCRFLGNVANQSGGGLGLRVTNASPTVDNCLFAWNRAVNGSGGGIQLGNGTGPNAATITQCTIAYNVAQTGGGIVVPSSGSAPTLVNSTIWGNSDYAGGSEESGQINGNNLFIRTCCVGGWTGLLGGPGNFDADPSFVSPCGCDDTPATADDDFRFQLGSACLDAGADASVPPDELDVDGDGDTLEQLPIDLAGAPRFLGTVDLGAFEGPASSPCAGSGVAVSFCQASPNSVSPLGALLSHTGSLRVSDANLTLESSPVPANTFGLFYYGTTQVEVVLGNGFRCIGGTLWRLNPPALTSAAGVATRSLDFNTAPVGSGGGRLLPGSTWHFQYWYRDALEPPAGFNLSNGLSLQFCP